MALDNHKNFAVSAVTTAPSPPGTGTSVTLRTGEGALFPAPPFNATIWPTGTIALASNAEIVRCTAKSGDVLTITRGQEGSLARAVLVGDLVAATFTAKMIDDIATAIQNPPSPVTITGAPNPQLLLKDPSQPVDKRLIILQNYGQQFYVQHINDALTVNDNVLIHDRVTGNLTITTGGYVEKGRITPMGHWTALAATMSIGGGSGSVSVQSALACQYTLIGKTITFQLYLQLSITGTPTYLRLAFPPGITSKTYSGSVAAAQGVGSAVLLQTNIGEGYLNFYKNINDTALGWSAGLFYVQGVHSCEIA